MAKWLFPVGPIKVHVNGILLGEVAGFTVLESALEGFDMAKKSTYEEACGYADYEHPSQSFADRHPKDRRLRTCGFKIYSRPKVGEPTWERDGQIYPQSKAVLMPAKRKPHPEVTTSVTTDEVQEEQL